MSSKTTSRICTQGLRAARSTSSRAKIHYSIRTSNHRTNAFSSSRFLSAQISDIPISQLGGVGVQKRAFASKSTADEIIEEITELYGTARDEFEIATEESEKHSVYAADDRAAAREELAKLLKRYNEVVGRDGQEGCAGKEVAEEVKRRIGGRLRELERAVEVLNEKDFRD